MQTTIRSLTAKYQRVLFSNIAPPIPHSVLEDIIECLGIKRNAPITTLKASLTKDGFSHVLSSRRQTYIDANDVKNLPELIKITYEEITYYIYPSTDQLKCFACKMEGHIAKHCTNNLEETDNNNTQIPNHILPEENSKDSPLIETTINNTANVGIISEAKPTGPTTPFLEDTTATENDHHNKMPPAHATRPPGSSTSTSTEDGTNLKPPTKKNQTFQ
ncbi:hypothetical protein TSAR_002666 [Trichomalopsis sarcophagae]|uniref:CCHC-type domain-containing protein n=1 Tax=Trichomalopsis sarcophagae TaxID=543379 RepID=A0A232EH09_9HYME|nr:hypothetical protein TSAR_002666 [Trichomalopsis sarcophagae]